MPKVNKQRPVYTSTDVTKSHTKHPNQTKQAISKHKKPKHSPLGWKCASIIDQQSAEAVAKLCAAAENKSAGATIKSLTLAPHIVHKKPTFAVTCETLRHLPLLKQLLASVGLLEQHKQLTSSAAYVLAYELLFGQGFRTKGPAENAVLQQQDRLQNALQELLQSAEVTDAAAWLLKQQQQRNSSLQLQPCQAVPHPRYARVNTLKASVAGVLQQLAKEGWQVQQQQHNSSAGAAVHSGSQGSQQSNGSARKRPRAGQDGEGTHKEQLEGQSISTQQKAAATGATTVQQGTVAVDDLLSDVLVFPTGTDLHDHPFVGAGVLLLQSKASCMPAHALNPQPGWHVVDACAAPGNKTTHVAALLAAARHSSGSNLNTSTSSQQVDTEPQNKNGKSSKKRSKQRSFLQQLPSQTQAQSTSVNVYAFDKDPKRLKRLQANVACTGAGNIVVAMQADFLSVDPTAPEYSQVRGVILDPSCSGSGTIMSRMEHLLPTATPVMQQGQQGQQTAGREQLTEEQQRLEQLAKFQEAALLHALKFPALQRIVYSTCSIHQRENEGVVAAVLPVAESMGFKLVDPFPAWHRRGMGVVHGVEKLVRTDPYLDGTDGFFVAVFERQG